MRPYTIVLPEPNIDSDLGLCCGVQPLNVGFRNTLSNNKLWLLYYKFLALREFGLNHTRSIYFYILQNLLKQVKLRQWDE